MFCIIHYYEKFVKPNTKKEGSKYKTKTLII